MARVIDLQEQTEITEDAYILTDNATTGTHKFNLKQLYDDSQRAIVSAQSAANSASSAAATAREVAASAQSVASEAESVVDGAAETLATAAERVDAAIDAVGDISELAVPEMSPDVRGGAKLDADGGLALRDGALGVGSLAQESDGQVRGGIASLTAKGHAEQQSTTGKNLAPVAGTDSLNVRGVAFTSSDGKFTMAGTFNSGATDGCRNYKNGFGAGSNYGVNATIASEDAFEIAAGTYTLSANLTDVAGKGKVWVHVGQVGEKGDVYSVDANNSSTTFTVGANAYAVVVIGTDSAVAAVNLTISNIQLELGSTATEYEPYSGGAPSPSPSFPQEIHVVRGRNLLDESTMQDGYLSSSNGIVSPSTVLHCSDYIDVSQGAYTVSIIGGTTRDTVRVCGYNSSKGFASLLVNTAVAVGANFTATFNVASDVAYVRISFLKSCAHPQLELGSTPTPYVPYGHVGMEARQGSTLLSTTPIPLPSRGWVGSLPDGTADVLRLDGAGHVEWELKDAETTTAATDGITGTVGTDVLSTTGQIVDGATVLYKLATPVTEDCGYCEDWPTDIPEGAVISIPELDAVNIKYFIDSSVTVLAKQWYARANSEYADRIEQLEAAVAEIVAGA